MKLTQRFKDAMYRHMNNHCKFYFRRKAYKRSRWRKARARLERIAGGFIVE